MECHKALVLLSGGIDSAACAHYYQQGAYSVEALFVDYGQAARVQEHEAATLIAEKMKLPISHIKVSGLPVLEGNIRGRNAALLTLALMQFPYQCGIISLGIHAGTPYEDCSPSFVKCMQSVFDLYSDGRIYFDAPFLAWTKAAVRDYAEKEGVPLTLTYSCESGLEPPCGECPSCRDVEVFHAR